MGRNGIVLESPFRSCPLAMVISPGFAQFGASMHSVHTTIAACDELSTNLLRVRDMIYR